MVELSDENLEHLLDDPGAHFDAPSDVVDSALSRDGKLRVLHAWRRWLLSDEWHAENTDESHRKRDLNLIDQAIVAVGNQGE